MTPYPVSFSRVRGRRHCVLLRYTESPNEVGRNPDGGLAGLAGLGWVGLSRAAPGWSWAAGLDWNGAVPPARTADVDDVTH